MDFISKVPDEVLLQIFSNVPYDGKQGCSLRGVSKKMDRVARDKALPKLVAKVQYPPFYLVVETLYPRRAFLWLDLEIIHQKWQDYQPWAILLPHADPDSLSTGITLIDACYTIILATHTTQFDIEGRIIRTNLTLARLVRKAIPIEALLLLRYIISLTDEALQATYFEDPAGDFALSTNDQDIIAVNCLFRSSLFENVLLSTASEAPKSLDCSSATRSQTSTIRASQHQTPCVSIWRYLAMSALVGRMRWCLASQSIKL